MSPHETGRTTGAVTVAAVTLLAGWLTGCATAPPARLELSQALASPQTYNDRRVELTGFVLGYEPLSGDIYRTLQFRLGTEQGEGIEVFGAGYTAKAIADASALVRNAFETHEPVTVVGTLSVSEGAPAELRLESLQYRGQTIAVTRGHRSLPGIGAGGWYIAPSIGVQAQFGL
jgi:hypothetical protein